MGMKSAYPYYLANKAVFANEELEVIDKLPLVEWFANQYKTFGATLEFITNRSQEGSQFCRGFGGIGGILRWRVDFQGTQHVEPRAPFPTPALRDAPRPPHRNGF